MKTFCKIRRNEVQSKAKFMTSPSYLSIFVSKNKQKMLWHIESRPYENIKQITNKTTLRNFQNCSWELFLTIYFKLLKIDIIPFWGIPMCYEHLFTETFFP